MNRALKRINILFATVLCAMFFPAAASAAQLYLEPDEKPVFYGDVFVIDLRLNSEGECVNAVDIEVGYDPRLLEAVDIGRGQSIMSLWVEQPQIDPVQGTIRLVAGVPGGYCGRVVGDPGQTNLIAQLVFSTTGNQIVEQPGATTTIFIQESSKVLLSDGFGSEADLLLKSAEVSIGGSRGFVNNEWLSVVNNDDIPPEPFEVRLLRNESVAGGKYYIVFSTQDKQSGMDHFEVFESSLEKEGYEVGTDKPAQWRRVETTEQYYVLLDQTLKSKVIVKAIDKAGNEQLSELVVEDRTLFGESGALDLIFFGSVILGVLIVIFGLVMFLRRGSRRRSDQLYEQDNEFIR